MFIFVLCSCVEPDGASYWAYKLEEEAAERELQRETTATADNKEDNSSQTQESDIDFVENDDSDSELFDYEDVDTTEPTLPWDGQIIEGDPSDGRFG